MKKLSWMGILLVSAALYAGHFGVGDVIFPMKLGQESGISWVPSAIGYVLINSILALLAYMMIAKAEKNLVETTSDIMGRSFGRNYPTGFTQNINSCRSIRSQEIGGVESTGIHNMKT